jgi:hypothetical protein
MTPDEQRIAIAEACGIVIHDHWGPLYKTPKGIVRVCPDYLNDLNAMHEAEKVLFDSPKKKHTYLQWLGCEDDYTSTVFASVTATAAQRADAFLRTIGKWEGAK